MNESKNQEKKGNNKVLTIIGIVLCVILVPILLINIMFIIKSYTNKSEVPKVGGYCPLIVLTESMDPVIKGGDLIIVHQADAKDISEGDIISYFDPASDKNSVVTHRVTEVINEDGKISFRTKGDSNKAEDKMLVPSDKLVGTYKTRIPCAGKIAMFMQTTAGLVVCVILPIILLIGYDFIRRKRYEKVNQKDTEKLLAELAELKAKKNTESSDTEINKDIENDEKNAENKKEETVK